MTGTCLKTKATKSILSQAWHYAGFLFVMVIVLSFSTGCSMIRTYKNAPTLSSVTAGHTYQVRVRTGNLALDRALYEYAMLEFGRYLVVSGEGPYTGYIDIVFESTSTTPLTVIPFSMIPWRKPVPGYKTNVAYGDAWFTGNDEMRLKGISQTTLTEITPGNASTWQDGTINVAIRDRSMQKLWAADYKYRGGWDLSGLAYVHTADEAARLCFYTVVEKFIKDYVTDPMEKKAAAEEAARKAAEAEDAVHRAGVGNIPAEDGKEKPKIALYKKSDKPSEAEKPVQLDPERWKYSGNNKDGVQVHIDKTTIYYPEAYKVQLWAATVRNNIQKVHFYEIGCLENKFRIIDQSPNKPSLTAPWTNKWTNIFPESTPELLYNAVCPKNARLKHRLNTNTEPASGDAARQPKVTAGDITSLKTEEETLAAKDTAEEIESPKIEDAVHGSNDISKKTAPAQVEETGQETEGTTEKIESRKTGPAKPVNIIELDTKKWKLLGMNEEDQPVHIDKLTISYPAAYVVKLWTATVNDDQKELELYEIGCMENRFRVINEATGKPLSASLWSDGWKTIPPASTPELIYNAVCPKKSRARRQMARK